LSREVSRSIWWGTAANGAETLEFFSQLQPDLMLMDLKMPVKDILRLLGAGLSNANIAAHLFFSKVTCAITSVRF